MIRSRNRCSRSVANRRGSCPASTTLSTVRNTVAASPAASASTVSSINATSVAPSRLTARGYVIPSSPAPAMSWSSTLSVSRGDPPPARMTSGNTVGSTFTPSWTLIFSTSPRMAVGVSSRNG